MNEILLELEHDVLNANFYRNSNIGGEGRAASMRDEEMIVNWLLNHSKWSKYTADPGVRRFGDFTLDINDKLYQINLKTSKYDFSSTFNINSSGGCDSFSKGGFLWGLSNIPHYLIPGSMGWDTFTDNLNRFWEDGDRDYWFFSLNKENMNQGFIRGLKQINHMYSNPSNTIQINFGFEHSLEPANRTHKEAREFIINKIKTSLIKKHTKEKYFLDEIRY